MSDECECGRTRATTGDVVRWMEEYDEYGDWRRSWLEHEPEEVYPRPATSGGTGQVAMATLRWDAWTRWTSLLTVVDPDDRWLR